MSAAVSLTRLSAKQRRVMRWWCAEADARYDALICDGAVRSGKTLCMTVSFFLWAMRSFDGRQLALCGKSVESLRRNVLSETLPVLRALGFACVEKRTEKLLTVHFAGHENRFLLFGGYDESSAALIQGVTLAGVLFDEAALMPRSFVEQGCARCSVEGSRLWFNCNPQGPGHWFYREWIEKAEEKRALRLHFTMDDNPSLSRRVRERYERAYSGVFYRRYVLGEWVAAEGRIYDFFDEQEYVCQPPEGPWTQWRVSVDYGTVNPTSMGLWGLCGGVWYRVKEAYYDSRAEGRQKTDEEYAAMLRELAGGRELSRVIVDPSAASFIETLRRAGLRVKRADNSVSDGIRVTAELLRQRKVVLCPACRDCLREMAEYRWEDGSDRPRKENDHAMDELRYFAMDVRSGERGAAMSARCVRR